MARLPNNEHVRQQFKSEFVPDVLKGPDERIAAAAEYAAFQLGQINKKLGQLLTSRDQTSAHAVAPQDELPPAPPSKPPGKSMPVKNPDNEW